MPTFSVEETGREDPQSKFLYLVMELSGQLDVFSFQDRHFLIVIGKNERSVPVRSCPAHHMKTVILHQDVIAGLLQSKLEFHAQRDCLKDDSYEGFKRLGTVLLTEFPIDGEVRII